MSNGYAIADDVVRFQAGWSVYQQNLSDVHNALLDK